MSPAICPASICIAPRLVLEQDTPLDTRFSWGFFRVHCRATFWTALSARIAASQAGAIPSLRRLHGRAPLSPRPIPP